MNALKEKLAPVIRHGFWIVTGIVTLGSLGIWFWSTSTLSKENADRTAKLEGDVRKVSTLRSELPSHPNEKSHELMQALIDGRTAQVIEAWNSVYDRQRDILTWPQTLRGDFLRVFEGKVPVERYISYPPAEDEEAHTDLLRRYEQYIKDILPSIAEIADAEWTAEFESAMAIGGDGGMDYGDDYGDDMGGGGVLAGPVDITGTASGPLVNWPTSSQEKVLSDLFPWRGTRPTTLQVHYSQENLWILKQLLGIVGDVNADASQAFQAKIRTISEIAIGESVDFETGAVAEPGEDQQDAYGMEDMGNDEDMYADMGMDMMSTSSGPYGSMDNSPDPADGRYLDMQGGSLGASKLRAALESNDPNDAGLAVAKRVPVMLKVQIDQRYIPRLLAACGNAPLMVEVKQVRVLPKGKRAGGSMYGDDAESMGGGGMMSGPVEDEFPLDVTAEVYGIINIYNPPSVDALGLDEVTEDTTIDGSDAVAPAPAPTATPAPETTPAVPGAAPAADPAGTETPATTPPPTTTPDPGDGTTPTAPVTAPPTAVITGN